jgi:hypothetical protein
MQKWWQKILLSVVVGTIMGHTFIPHHHHAIDEIAHHQDHHDEQAATGSHHEHEHDQEDHHNIFSFAQLDKDFVPVKVQKVNFDLPILYLLTPLITFQLSEVKRQSKTHFGHYREFPPPAKYISQLFSRPPPFC